MRHAKRWILLALMLAASEPRPAGAELRNSFDPEQALHAYAPEAHALGPGAFASDGLGNFLVAWTRIPTSGPWPTALVAQRLDRQGAKLGGEIEVASFDETRTLDGSPQVHGRPAGGFLVSWEEYLPGASEQPLRIRSFDADGSPVGTEVVLTVPFGGVSDPAPGSGDFLAVYSKGDPVTLSDVYVRLISADGTSVGNEVLLNTDMGDFQNAGVAASFGDGNFLVTWSHTHDNFDDGSVMVASWDVHARIVDAAGSPFGPAFQVSSTDSGGEFPRAALRLPNGNVLVVFTRHFGALDGVYGREIDSSGSALGDEFLMAPTSCWPYSSGFAVDGNNLVATLCREYGRYQNMSLVPFDLTSRLAGPPFLLRRNMVGDEVAASVAGDPLGGFLAALRRVAPVEQEARDEILLRRACDPADPDCHLCLGFDDAVDEDGDGTPAGCDPCDAAAPTTSFGKPVLDLRFVGLGTRDAARGGNRLDLRAVLDLPVEVTSLDPPADGMRLQVETLSNGAVLDVTLPGGTFAGRGTRGWKPSATGDRWLYLDRTGEPLEGIRSLMLYGVPAVGPKSAKLKVVGRDAPYVVEEVSSALRVTLMPAGTVAATAGLCLEHTFADSACISPSPDRTTCAE